MCGVPYHSVQSYLAKLLKKGFKVAICEQMENPKSAKGVVKREIIKVLTPGTAVEVDQETAKESLTIASLLFTAEGWGLALIDLSTGEMRAAEGPAADIKTPADELFRSAPREIVLPEGEASAVCAPAGTERSATNREESGRSLVLRIRPGPPRSPRTFQSRHTDRLWTGRQALGRVRRGRPSFLYQASPQGFPGRRRRLSYLQSADRLLLDAATIRNLELVRNLRDGRVENSLLDVIDIP